MIMNNFLIKFLKLNKHWYNSTFSQLVKLFDKYCVVEQYIFWQIFWESPDFPCHWPDLLCQICCWRCMVDFFYVYSILMRASERCLCALFETADKLESKRAMFTIFIYLSTNSNMFFKCRKSACILIYIIFAIWISWILIWNMINF